jgi:putative DNA primase/helicase
VILEGLILPVRPGEKATYLLDWPNATAQPVIQPGDNVALRLEHLTDLDLDCAEAIAVAARVIASTCSFGRPTGAGHYLFSVPDSAYEIFKDIDESTLLEIRHGAGHYTVIPPSKVPRKSDPSLVDELIWAREVAPRVVTYESLRLVACSIATASLVIRHWPKGGRHNGLLALAGFLARHAVPANIAVVILEEITRHAEGEAWSECATSVRDTYAALEAGAKTTGGRVLAKWLGAAVVDRLREYFRDTDDALEFDLNEEGDAQAFASMYGDRVRFFHRSGSWAMTDDESGIWVPDSSEQIIRYTSDLMVDRYKKATTNKARAWAHAGHSRKRITNTYALARSIDPISVAASDTSWDSQPFLLGVPNGVVDLRDGSLRRAQAEEKITMRARVAYDPTATCPLWEQTLLDIFTFASSDGPNDGLPLTESPEDRARSLVEFLQRAIGYSLTGDVREECFFICWGTGRNGKGTLVNLIYWLLGDYADNLAMGTLEEHAFQGAGGSPRPDIAKLPGKRMVTASENRKTATLDEEMIKKVTGRDPVTVRQLYKSEFTFDPIFKLWLMVNNKPEGIREEDVALWARIHLIPFLRSFDGCADTTLKDRLKLEAAGILNWAVRGAIEWQRHGLQPPAVVKAATQQYRSESDQLAPFFEAQCVVAPNISSKTGELLRAYQHWCGESGQGASFNHKTFVPALIARGFSIDQSKPKQYTWIKGIGLRLERGEETGKL